MPLCVNIETAVWMTTRCTGHITQWVRYHLTSPLVGPLVCRLVAIFDYKQFLLFGPRHGFLHQKIIEMLLLIAIDLALFVVLLLVVLLIH